MAEELPSGVFLLILKITTMKETIFIVTRQNFYVSRNVHYAMAMYCPVVVACQSRLMVDEFFERRIPDFIAKGFVCEHVKEDHSLGVVERYIIKDKCGVVDCAYSVIIEPLM